MDSLFKIDDNVPSKNRWEMGILSTSDNVLSLLFSTGESKEDRRNTKKQRRKAFLAQRKEKADWHAVTQRPHHWYEVSSYLSRASPQTDIIAAEYILNGTSGGMIHPPINRMESWMISPSLQVRPDGVWEEHRRSPKQRSEFATKCNKATHGNARKQGSFEPYPRRGILPTGTQFTLEGMRPAPVNANVHMCTSCTHAWVCPAV